MTATISKMRTGMPREGDSFVRDAAGEAVDRLCFLADALMAKPSSDLEATCRRGLGGILEDVAVMLADALAQERAGVELLSAKQGKAGKSGTEEDAL